MIYHFVFMTVVHTRPTSYIISFVHTLRHTIIPLRCVIIQSKDGVRNSKLRKRSPIYKIG
jgi:hypothetical protein